MLKIRIRKILIIALLLVSTLPVISLYLPTIAFAAAPKCYQYTNQQGGVPGYGEIDCSGMIEAVATNPDLPPFDPAGQDDKCFKFEIYASSVGAAVVSWAEESCETLGNVPPVCFKGVDITYQGETIHVYRDDFCTPEYETKIGRGFEANTCYLIEYQGVDNATSDYAGATDCETMRQAVADDADKHPDSPDTDGGTSTTHTQPTNNSVASLPNVQADELVVAPKIMSFVFALVGAITVLMLAFGGFKYVTSQGEPQATAKAKNTILYALVGLIVVIVAANAVRYIVENVG